MINRRAPRSCHAWLLAAALGCGSVATSERNPWDAATSSSPGPDALHHGDAALTELIGPDPERLDATLPGPPAKGADLIQSSEAQQRVGWTLVFADEFEGEPGSPPQPGRWLTDTRVGTSTNSQEAHTDRAENVRLDGLGHLSITARAESFHEAQYTTGFLTTQNRFAIMYGRFEIAYRAPSAKGLWPAFWLIGTDYETPWPARGQINVIQQLTHDPLRLYPAVAGANYTLAFPHDAGDHDPDGTPAPEFTRFCMEWDAAEIRWYIADTLYQRYGTSDVPDGSHWDFDHSFFMVLMLAVGGDWAGPVVAEDLTPERSEMLIDYVRVYARDAE